MSTSNEGFAIHHGKKGPSKEKQEIRQYSCGLNIICYIEDHEENYDAQSDEEAKAPGTPGFFLPLDSMILKRYACWVMTLERSFHRWLLIFFFVCRPAEISSYQVGSECKTDTKDATEDEETSDPEFL